MKKVKFIFIISLIGALAYVATKNYFFHPNVYPIKSSIFAWAGDTKIMASSPNTIDSIELKRMRALLKPGDIFLNRSDYYISNIGIPGFWTHAGLYIGDVDERNEFFKNDVETTSWIKEIGESSGNLEKLLQGKCKTAYNSHIIGMKDLNIIESVSEGVIISSFKQGAQKEGIVILRPLLEKKEIAAAIFKAFGEVSKPYDYNFDFSTEDVIACTELVYKVYESSTLFPVHDMFGKPFSTANEIAEYCDENYDSTELKLAMIYIYDGSHGYTPENDTAHAIFRKSWNESLW